jgi:hypothetical protein
MSGTGLKDFDLAGLPPRYLDDIVKIFLIIGLNRGERLHKFPFKYPQFSASSEL